MHLLATPDSTANRFIAEYTYQSGAIAEIDGAYATRYPEKESHRLVQPFPARPLPAKALTLARPLQVTPNLPSTQYRMMEKHRVEWRIARCGFSENLHTWRMYDFQAPS
jgi:hypothetical protein